MTDMTAEQEMRQRFEEWWLFPVHDYMDVQTQIAWENWKIAWNAALTAPRVPEGAFRILVAAGNRIAAEAEEVEGDEGMAVQILLDYWHGFLTALDRAKGSLTAATAPTEHVARVGTMEVTMDDECRVSRAVLRDAADVLRDYTDKPREAAPAPADSFAKNYDVTGDGVAVLKPEAARRMIGLDKPMPLFETAQGGELTKLRERVRELEQSLEAARGWLQAGLSAINMSGQRGGSDE